MRLDIYHIFLGLFLYQCSHSGALDIEKTYRKNLRFEVDGEEARGVFSAKKKQSYRIEILVPQKPNIVKVTSCHQEKIFIKPGKEIEFQYRPDSNIEAGDLPCVLEISALEASGRNQWGMIDFKLVPETLSAKIQCNGESASAKGSYICQSRRDLIQSIEFDAEVTSYAPEQCNKIAPELGKKFYLSVSKGNCFYIFSDKTGNLFRLLTFGYDEIVMDEE